MNKATKEAKAMRKACTSMVVGERIYQHNPATVGHDGPHGPGCWHEVQS